MPFNVLDPSKAHSELGGGVARILLCQGEDNKNELEMMKVRQRNKPRNPFVRLVLFRKAGTHGKTKKALRRHQRSCAENRRDDSY